MAERQKHGFDFENIYIKNNDLIKEENYTAPFDAYDIDGEPYQIKTIKKNSSIDLGDIFRNASKDRDFYLIVSFWENSKSNIVEIKKMYIPYIVWNEILKFDDYEEMKDWITNKVSNSHNYDNKWKQERLEWKKRFGNRKINIRFKRDHKSQRRIQCAINKNVFYSYFVKEFEIE